MVRRDPYPPANPSSPGPGRAGSAHNRRAGGGSGMGVWCWLLGKAPALRASRAPLPRGACPPREPAAPRVSIRKPSEPPAHFLTCQGRRAWSASRLSSLRLGRAAGGLAGHPHSPPCASARTSAHLGLQLGEVFSFSFSFFYKLSLLSLLGATWWCAGGVSLPPRAPPFSLSPPSRPPLFPPQWMEAGRLQARSPR